MNKKLTIIALIVLVLSMSVFGEDLIDKINIDSLIEEGVENNLSLKSKNLTLENKELRLTKIEKDAVNANQLGGDRVTFINNRIKVLSDPLVGNMEVWIAKQDIINSTDLVKDNIYKKGLNYLLANEEIKLKNYNLENMKIYLTNLEEKVNKGLNTQTELTNKQLDIQLLEGSIIELELNRDLLLIEFNHLVGKTLESPLSLEGEIKLLIMKPISITSYFEDHYSLNVDVYEKSVLSEARTIEFDLYASQYNDYTQIYKTALYNKQLAEIELKEAVTNYEVQIRSSYNNVLNNKANYELSVKQLELQELLYSQTQFKFEKGLVTIEEVLVAQDSLKNSEFNVKKTIVNYNTAWIDFNNLK